MLALAKLGSAAIPQILDRIANASAGPESQAERTALIKTLGMIGGDSIPSLVQLATQATSLLIRTEALEQIVALEPVNRVFGQRLNPWTLWRPEDDRLQEIQQAVTPYVPQFLMLLQLDAMHERPRSLEAYLLARWGAGAQRGRGLQILDEFARTSTSLDQRLASAQLLWR